VRRARRKHSAALRLGRHAHGQMNKSFLVLFFKKEQEKALLFEKKSKNFW
jgi:hypothetical protein